MKRYSVIFDLETGGVKPHHPNIQLAAIAIDDETGAEVSSFERKIQFNEEDADPEALRINHYDRSVWVAEAQPESKVLALFVSWSRPYHSLEMKAKSTGRPFNVGVLVGHNIVAFDFPRLQRAFGSGFLPFSFHTPDTLQRAMFYFREHPELERPANLQLSTLCEYFGVSIEGAHDALADVRMCNALALAIAAAERGARAAGI